MHLKYQTLCVSLLFTGCGSVQNDTDSIPAIHTESSVTDTVSSETTPSAFPAVLRKSTVRILKDETFHCTGVAIASKLIVTAAHCVYPDSQPERYHIQSAANRIMIQAKELNYFSTSPENRQHRLLYWPGGDIAWLKTSDPLPDEIQAVPVLAGDEGGKITARRALIAGFGSTRYSLNDGGTFRHAQTTIAHVYRSGPFKGVLHTFSPDGSGPCRGDSGGPLFLKHHGRYVLAGISSGLDSLIVPEADLLQDPCTTGQAVYMDFPAWLPWIKKSSLSEELPDAPLPSPGPQAHTLPPETISEWCRYASVTEGESLLLRSVMIKLGASRCQDIPEKLSGFNGRLNLDNMGLKQVSPLGDIKGLVSLSLKNNQIAEIKAGSLPEGLKHLDLSENPVSFLAPAAAPSSLESFVLHAGEIPANPGPGWAQFFSRAGKLSSLVMTNTGLSQPGNLAPLSLKNLNLVGNKLISLNFIKNSDSLEELYLNRNQLEDVCQAGRFNSLRLLTLSSNRIKSLACLSGLSRLEMLSAWNNPFLKREPCPVPEAVPGDICEF